MGIVAPLVIFKFLTGWGALAFLCFTVQIIMLFHKKGEPIKKDSFSYWLIKTGNRWVARYGMAMFGCPYIKEDQIM